MDTETLTQLLEIKPQEVKGLPGLYLPHTLGILAKSQILAIVQKIDAVDKQAIARSQTEADEAKAKGQEYDQNRIGVLNTDELAERTGIYSELLEPVYKQYAQRFQATTEAPSFITFEAFADRQTESSLLTLTYGLFGMVRDPNA
jgi:hypothetical protein